MVVASVFTMKVQVGQLTLNPVSYSNRRSAWFLQDIQSVLNHVYSVLPECIPLLLLSSYGVLLHKNRQGMKVNANLFADLETAFKLGSPNLSTICINTFAYVSKSFAIKNISNSAISRSSILNWKKSLSLKKKITVNASFRLTTRFN